MDDYSLLKVIWPHINSLEKKHKAFVLTVRKQKILSTAQHQYLQGIYDALIAKAYGLEPMSTDQEYARNRAKRKKRL